MIKIKKYIQWKYVVGVLVFTICVCSLGIWRYSHGQEVIKENIHRQIVVVEKDCGSSKFKNRLYFYDSTSKKQHLSIKKSDCESVNFGDTINALYDKDYNLYFYKEMDFVEDGYSFIGFLILGLVLLATLVFDFVSPFRKQ